MCTWIGKIEDPSIHYVGTEFEGLDAYERQLKRFEIKEEYNEKEEETTK